MRMRNTVILVVIAALLAAWFFFVEQPRQKNSQKLTDAGTDLADFDVDEAVTVSIERPDVTLAFARTGQGRWRMTSPAGDRAADGAVNRLLGVLSDGEIHRDLGGQEDAAPFGLAPPAAIITVVTAGQDTVVSLEVGNFTVEKYNVYARRRGDSSILLIPTGVRRYSMGDPSTFRNRKLTEFEIASVSNFTVMWPESSVTWRRDENKSWITETAGETIQGRTRRVEAMLRRIRGLRADEFVPLAEIPVVQPLQRERHSVSVVLNDGSRQDLAVGRRLESRVYAGSRFGEETDYRIVLTDTTVLDVFRQTLSELRDRRLVDFKGIRLGKIVLESPAFNLTLVRPGGEWGYLNPALGPVDQPLVGFALTALTNLEFTDVLEPDMTNIDAFGLSNGEIRITLFDEAGVEVVRLTAARAADAPGGGYAATSRHTNLITSVDGATLEELIGRFEELRSGVKEGDS
jgi:hypothetical protein